MKACSDHSLAQYSAELAADNDIGFVPGISCNKELVAEIVKHYSPALRTYFYNRLRSHNDVEDFLQELYCRTLAYKNPEKIRSIKKFVFTIALNLVRDNSRRCATRLRQSSIPIEPDMVIDETIEPERIIEHCHQLKQVNLELNKLHPKCKEAFWLNRIEGLSYKEVAFKMGVTVSMIEKHLMLASKKIQGVKTSLNGEALTVVE